MPTYARPNSVGASIRSLLEGDWRDFELLVRDDGDGCDGTEQAVRAAAAGDARVQYYRNPRRLMMPGNINDGIRASRGEFVAICHDHDLYRPSFLAELVAALNRNRSALFAHCAVEVIDDHGTVVASHAGDWPELVSGREWLKVMLRSLSCPVCALTVVRRHTYEEYGLYDPDYGFVADVEMWMRLALYGDVAYVRRPLVQLRVREKTHPANAAWARLPWTVAKIHRRYLSRAYCGVTWLRQRADLERRLMTAVFRGAALASAQRWPWVEV